MMNSIPEMKPELYGVNDKTFPEVDKLEVGDTVDLIVKVKIMSKTERVKSNDPIMGSSGGCSVSMEVNSITLAGTKRMKDLSIGEFNNAKSEAIRQNK